VSLRFTLLRHLPAAAVRGYVLDRLARATAEAFGAAAPAWNGLRYSDRMRAYARFTTAWAAQAGDEQLTRKRLHSNAEVLGAEFRRRAGIRGPEEAFRALAFLYGQIGIEITGIDAAAPSGGPSGMTVARCFFSDFYDPATCRLMSAFDAGVVAGLFGGTSLEFSERITEGAGCCRASLGGLRGPA
jgi:hypothetical protein